MPLKRVERINYKCLEIGQMRKDLGVLKNPEVNYNKEVCRKLAGNLFEKRKREGSANYYIPVLTTDNIKIYNDKEDNKLAIDLLENTPIKYIGNVLSNQVTSKIETDKKMILKLFKIIDSFKLKEEKILNLGIKLI